MLSKEYTVEYEVACDRLRDDIAQLLVDMDRPNRAVAAMAAAATYELADAFHHAAGSPGDARWDVALLSLEAFVNTAGRSARAPQSDAFATLRAFLDENRSVQRLAA